MLKSCTVQQLANRLEAMDQMICFGAGKRFDMLIKWFANTKVWDKINYIVDNAVEKQNTEIEVSGKKIKIISFQELMEMKLDNCIIIVTCVSYADILKQLETETVFEHVDIYCLSHILLLESEKEAFGKKIPVDIRLYSEILIPKIIHYCWFGRNPIPEKYKIWMDSWHKFCPDYEIIEWNEDNYDITKNLYMKQAYENKKWGYVPDYARLDIIYNYGGIYLDTDVELVGNIDDLLYQKGFAGFQSNKQVNLGLGFGAIKGLPIIKEMRDLYHDIRFVHEDGGINDVPSPEWQTKVLEEHGLHTDGEYQVIEGLTVYPEKMFCGKHMFTRRIALAPYTRAIHHFDGSWVEQTKRDKWIKLETDWHTLDA